MKHGLMTIAFLVPVLLLNSGHELLPAQTATMLGELCYTIALATILISQDKA